MTIRGPLDGSTTLHANLNERHLLLLARDVLTMRGHEGIRVVDGPGDGGRDLFSVTASGEPHVTQVTHPMDASKTIGACTAAW